jgi:hypothetical protein
MTLKLHRGYNLTDNASRTRLECARLAILSRMQSESGWSRMNPSYCRIRVPKDEALRRLAAWRGLPRIGPLVETDSMRAIALACDERGMWRGGAVFISPMGEWTLIQDLSGCLGGTPGSEWLKFAGSDDLVFAGYNDAIGYGELVAIGRGKVLREFLHDESSPEEDVNVGKIDSSYEPFQNWIQIASFVDDDELAFSDAGWLWVLVK